jgi:hypothetical protein
MGFFGNAKKIFGMIRMKIADWPSAVKHGLFVYISVTVIAAIILMHIKKRKKMARIARRKNHGKNNPINFSPHLFYVFWFYMLRSAAGRAGGSDLPQRE